MRRWTYHLLANGAAGALGTGDPETAEGLLSQMREHRESARPLDLCTYHYYRAWLHMLRREWLAAFQEQKAALDLAVECGCPLLRGAVPGCHRPDPERDRGRRPGDIASAQGAFPRRDIRNRLLEFYELMVFAYVTLKQGRRRQGLGSLRLALGVGRENGYTHFLWWRPSLVSRLCAWALEEGIEVDYVRRLVPRTPSRSRGQRPPQPALAPGASRSAPSATSSCCATGSPLGVRAKLQKKPLELLKTLVGFGAESVPESRLAGSMWPRIDADYARGSLTTTLHRLRKLVGEDRLIALRHGRLSINARLCWMDLRAFEAVTAGDRRRAAPRFSRDDEGQVEGWAEELFANYRGPFMDSEGERPCYLLLRGRLRNRFLRSVGELARYWEEREEWERAADYYERGIEADGLAESLYRRLMLCYREIGRVVEAIDTYDRLRSTLEVRTSGRACAGDHHDLPPSAGPPVARVPAGAVHRMALPRGLEPLSPP